MRISSDVLGVEHDQPAGGASRGRGAVAIAAVANQRAGRWPLNVRFVFITLSAASLWAGIAMMVQAFI